MQLLGSKSRLPVRLFSQYSDRIADNQQRSNEKSTECPRHQHQTADLESNFYRNIEKLIVT
jgi:hypothetical protein